MAKKTILKSPQDEQQEKDAAVYKMWMDELESAKIVFKDYTERCKRILRTYKDERKSNADISTFGNSTHKLNILWSNIQVLQPAMYAKTPEPNVTRRFLDRDPVSRAASLIVERNLETAQELADFDYVMKRVRDDYLLCGRGTAWVRFAPEIGQVPRRVPVTRIQLGDSGRSIYRPFQGGDEIPEDQIKQDEEGYYAEPENEEQILAYGLALDHVAWNDFLHEPVGDWSKVGWIAKRVLMKRPQLITVFGKDIGVRIKLNKSWVNAGKDAQQSDDTNNSGTKRGRKGDAAEIWEIWDKSRRQVLWISDGYEGKVIRQQKDPLGLVGFFPCPRPIYATLTTDSLVPVPDYALYQDQAEQIDQITDRIRLLIQALRVVGMYNAESEDLQRVLGEAQENEMIPVANWMSFAQSGGMKTNVDWLPIEQIQAVLTGLFQARSQLKNDLYEVSGMSDIVRGATVASETATAQQIKANFSNMRLQDRQGEFARFCRDVMRIMGEIQCEHYDPEALIEMSGISEMDEFRADENEVDPNNPQSVQEAQAFQQKSNATIQKAVELLKTDRLRTFRIDMETDATAATDQEAEKKARVEFLSAVAPFLEKAASVGQVAPQLVPLLMKMLDFGVRGFRTGRSLEAAIDQTIAEIEKMQKQAQAQQQQGPPPDPKAQAEQAKAQADQQKAQLELQSLMLKFKQAQAQAQVDMEKIQAEKERNQQEFQMKLAEFQAKAQQAQETAQLEVQKLVLGLQQMREEHALKIRDLELDVQLKEVQLIMAQKPEAPEEPEPEDPNDAHRVVTERAKLLAEHRRAQFDTVKLERALREFMNGGPAGGGIAPGGIENLEPDDVLGLNAEGGSQPATPPMDGAEDGAQPTL